MKYEIKYYTQANKEKSAAVEVQTEAELKGKIDELADDPNEPLAQVKSVRLIEE